MGARLRLKASQDISAFAPDVQKIFRAMKRYGLIVADNGSDMYISGTMDARWNNDVLNPAFAALTADDFEVIQLGWGQGTAARRTGASADYPVRQDAHLAPVCLFDCGPSGSTVRAPDRLRSTPLRGTTRRRVR